MNMGSLHNRRIFDAFDARPDISVYIQSILPTSFNIRKDRIKELNSFLYEETAKRGYTFVNLYDDFATEDDGIKSLLSYDGRHLTRDGYMLWKNSIYDFVVS